MSNYNSIWWKEYYQKNREKLLERAKKWNYEHKDYVKRNNEQMHRRRLSNPPLFIIRYHRTYELVSLK